MGVLGPGPRVASDSRQQLGSKHRPPPGEIISKFDCINLNPKLYYHKRITSTLEVRPRREDMHEAERGGWGSSALDWEQQVLKCPSSHI